jgi:large subunit ribosomal protein L4
MRRLALRCVLSAKAGDGELKVLDAWNFEEPKTKKMAEVLSVLGVNSSALIVTPEPEDNVIKSARNLKKVKTTPVNIINVLDILSHKMLLITEEAVRRAEKMWGNTQTQGGDDASVRGATAPADN